MYVCLNLAGASIATVKRFVGYPNVPNPLIIDRTIPDMIDDPDELLALCGFGPKEWQGLNTDILIPWGALWEGALAKAIHKFGLGQGIRTFPVIGNRIFGQELGMQLADTITGHFPEVIAPAPGSPAPTEIVLDFVGISIEAEESVSSIIGGSHRRVIRVKTSGLDAELISKELEALPIQQFQWDSPSFGVILPWDNAAARLILGAVMARTEREMLHCYTPLGGWLVWYIWVMTI